MYKLICSFPRARALREPGLEMRLGGLGGAHWSPRCPACQSGMRFFAFLRVVPKTLNVKLFASRKSNSKFQQHMPNPSHWPSLIFSLPGVRRILVPPGPSDRIQRKRIIMATAQQSQNRPCPSPRATVVYTNSFKSRHPEDIKRI